LIFENAYEDEYPNTKIALGTFLTSVAFTKIEFMEYKYYDLLYPKKN